MPVQPSGTTVSVRIKSPGPTPVKLNLLPSAATGMAVSLPAFFSSNAAPSSASPFSSSLLISSTKVYTLTVIGGSSPSSYVPSSFGIGLLLYFSTSVLVFSSRAVSHSSVSSAVKSTVTSISFRSALSFSPTGTVHSTVSSNPLSVSLFTVQSSAGISMPLTLTT